MNLITLILIIAIIGGGSYFAYWAIQKTLKEDESASKKRMRRMGSKRR